MSFDKLEETNIDLALMKENRRILLVDDEPYNIMGMKIVLHQSGIKNLMQFVDIVYNGQQAVDLVKNAFKQNKYSYGLIFMDCSMPVMNGYEASDLIRDFVKTKKLIQPMIVATTGHTENEYIQKCWLH